MNKFLILSCCLAIAACSAKLTGPSQADADRGKSTYSDITVEKLNKGKLLVETHCGTCHPVKSPDSRTVTQWNTIVPEMVAKVNKKAMTTELDAEEERLILMYVTT